MPHKISWLIMQKRILWSLLFVLNSIIVFSQSLEIKEINNEYLPVIGNQEMTLKPPSDGLWSISMDWQNDWPSNWQHARAVEMTKSGPWTILKGALQLPEGDWNLQDAYRLENNRIKCIRRFEWTGEEALEKVTLSVRWKINGQKAQAFLPNILYYGNPSGEKNGKERVPIFHGEDGEMALFEEHRYTMPFAALEWKSQDQLGGAALHTLPSPVSGGNKSDQWWSLGTRVLGSETELLLLSGPVAYNGEKNIVKALQRGNLNYGDTYMSIQPGMIIEKTFYLEVFPIEKEGTTFQRPIHTAIDIFKPFYVEEMPTYTDIIEDKYRFAKSRWIEGKDYAGFNMYPEFVKQRIVLGWAGQSEALGYALQPLANRLGEKDKIEEMVQKALDHIATSPVGEKGFAVRYEVEDNRWHSPDPVSEGQAMNSIALAIRSGRKNPNLATETWESFLKKACKVSTDRILDPNWNPINTAEAFYISPLFLSATLFDEPRYATAALKAVDYYAERHLSMREPYWGGTLDATCEDKEGAWGAFQGFMAAYEYTKDKKYLEYAQHAGDVVLSYTVVWDIPLPPGRMSDHHFKTRGWTGVSPQNQHLDVYGVLITPTIYKLGEYTDNEVLKRLSILMYRSCGQMIDPLGSQGEQLQNTNFAQRGEMTKVSRLRGGYSEDWTVFWITAHFLHAAAQFEEMGVDL